jgi:streptogramin lyase
MRWGLAGVACGLMVLAGCGGSSSSSSSSNQPPPTLPPVANAGGPYTGTVGVAVTFNGSGSSDPQHQALTYAWNFGDNTGGSGVSPTHIYAQVAGAVSVKYTVGLTVTDTSGLNAQTTTSATIQGVAPLADAAMTGVVMAGHKPIAGARVYLLAANTTGYGGTGFAASSSNASVSLENATETGASDSLGAYVVTDSFGHFSLSGLYSCSSGQQLYLYALGGNSGSGANSSSGLLAAIGSCPNTGSTIAVTVNEVSTVAAAYAFAGFATDATHVSSSGTTLAQVGIANAFANAANLANLATGVAMATTVGSNVTAPQAEINTLANILSTCVDPSDSVANSCALLFGNAISGGLTGNTPTETATAAINIAHNPAINTTTLFQIPASSPPYAPALGSAPPDYTIALTFTGGGLSGPQGIAIDSLGNAWVTSFSGNSVAKFSSSGTALSGTAGYTGGGLNEPFGIAIDASGNAWVANYGSKSVTELSSSGSPAASSPFAVGGLNPQGIALDGTGNVWIANYGGNSVTKLTSSGTAASGSPYSVGGLNKPFAVAIDGSGGAWIANNGGNSVTGLTSSGSALSGSPFTGGGLLSPIAVAVDSAGNTWIADNTNASVTKLSHSGSVLSGAGGYTGGALDFPYSLAIDGSGNVWTASQNPYNLTELSSTGGVLSGPDSYFASGLNLPTAIAIDGSGNAWVVNNGGNSVSEFIGVAPPVVTPIAAGLPATPTANGSSTLGTQP